MRQVNVTIPDSFYKKFLDFVKNVPDAKIEEVEEFSIPEWQKKETLHRLNTSKRADFIPWSQAKKHLKSI